MGLPAAFFAASAAMSGLGSFQQSRQAAQVADFNAEVAAVNAVSEREWAAAEEARTRREAGQRRGTSVARMGASGLVAQEGSFGDVLSDEAIESELEALTIRAQGEQRARGFEAQQAGQRLSARHTRRSAPLSALGAAARAGGPFIASKL